LPVCCDFCFYSFSWVINYCFLLSCFWISSFSFGDKEVSQKINGLLSLSIDQLLSLNIFAFSILKRDSKAIVACKFMGDNLLCSDKKFSFFVIVRIVSAILRPQTFLPGNKKATPKNGELQIVLLIILFTTIAYL